MTTFLLLHGILQVSKVQPAEPSHSGVQGNGSHMGAPQALKRFLGAVSRLLFIHRHSLVLFLFKLLYNAGTEAP